METDLGKLRNESQKLADEMARAIRFPSRNGPMGQFVSPRVTQASPKEVGNSQTKISTATNYPSVQVGTSKTTK